MPCRAMSFLSLDFFGYDSLQYIIVGVVVDVVYCVLFSLQYVSGRCLGAMRCGKALFHGIVFLWTFWVFPTIPFCIYYDRS